MMNLDWEWSAGMRTNESAVPRPKAHAEDHINPYLGVVAKYVW